MSKALRFLHNGQTSRFSFFNHIFDVLTSRTSRRLLEEKAPVKDIERTVSSEKIGNDVISLQLRYRGNPDHDIFSSLSNTEMAIFPSVCLWRPSLS